MMLNKLWLSRTVVPRSCRKFKRFSSTLGGRLTISPEVTRALKSGKPVVALESTIITHGMPYPENYLTAHELEEIIRSLDCIPATVAIVGGHIHVGITKYLMDDLASMKTPAYKTSRRDLPYVISKGLYGGTTVSATMIAAKMAGINVFVTGGIGGVHRGASSTMDISADLTELGRTPVAVISSGVKSILDVGKTLEYLETQGVCVATFGARREFPSFFSPQAIGDDGKPLLSPYNVSTPREAAELIHANLTLELKSGVLIAVPPPPEGVVAEEMADVEAIIQETLEEVKEKGIKGKDVTPYVLREVAAKTNGKSLTANIALVQHNAMVGAQIAKELQEIINTKKEREQLSKLNKEVLDIF
ncbi:pseudouridine-5'-phosphate glycosidase-like isoform X2 [Ischnura elegans]|uniref:pseudouridine-5'-phosphate glycosidase-like isoform X2 n=1 Tax=Ischnura elegans TaxID=197161 RepID=UPI001ED8A596|nr:pseudouridine-5'-phosphate glycosidase-like isoform X2 [Ischnura elegans]